MAVQILRPVVANQVNGEGGGLLYVIVDVDLAPAVKFTTGAINFHCSSKFS